MADRAALRSAAPASSAGVVRPLTRGASRGCARPGCPAPAEATLAFRYETREAIVELLDTDEPPQTYDLCGPHADRTRPPHGWRLDDRRPARDDAAEAAEAPRSPVGGDERTVAVLASALRGDGREDASPVLAVADAPDEGPEGLGHGPTSGVHEAARAAGDSPSEPAAAARHW